MADYSELARQFGADLLDVAEARRRFPRVGSLIERVAGIHGILAWATFRLARRYDTVVTDGEQVGLPLAILTRFTPGRRARHVMIAHVMSVPKKVRLVRFLRLASQIDLLFAYSSWQRDFMQNELHFAPEKLVLTPFMVDTRFFSIEAVTPQPRNAICSAGLEHRDYVTLIEAVRDLPVDVVIASGSPWSRQPNFVREADLPVNVSVCTLNHFDLRQLYADCRFVVVPLEPVTFQAGVTTILEAMAMGKAVICSRTLGQTDVIEHGRTGLYVEPKDPEALAVAIRRLLDDPEFAAQLGAAGCEWVQRADVRSYAAALTPHVRTSALTGARA